MNYVNGENMICDLSDHAYFNELSSEKIHQISEIVHRRFEI